MKLALKFRALLPAVLVQELDNLVTAIVSAFNALGRFTPIEFAVSAFTSDAAGTWAVGAGNVADLRYSRINDRAKVWFDISATTITGAPFVCYIDLPPAIRAKKRAFNTCMYFNNATQGAAYAFITAGSTRLVLLKADATALAAATDTGFFGQIEYEVSNGAA